MVDLYYMVLYDFVSNFITDINPLIPVGCGSDSKYVIVKHNKHLGANYALISEAVSLQTCLYTLLTLPLSTRWVLLELFPCFTLILTFSYLCILILTLLFTEGTTRPFTLTSYSVRMVITQTEPINTKDTSIIYLCRIAFSIRQTKCCLETWFRSGR